MKDLRLTLPSNATVWGRMAPELVSFTMDWWSERHLPWGNASVLNANLQDPQLIELASALAPSFWRIGGSQADTIVYSPFHNSRNTSIDHGNRTTVKPPKCKPNRCLTMDRWDEILEFAAKIGARIVFGLNYLSHTQGDTMDWDSTVTRQFLNYTRHHALGSVIFGYELGNELTHGGKASNLTRMVVAYQELRSIVDDLYQIHDDDSSSSRSHLPRLAKPKIMGPASTGRATLVRLLKKLGPELDIVTYHKYHARGDETSTRQDVEAAMKPSFQTHAYHYQETSKAVYEYFYQQRKYVTNYNDDNNLLWIGEGAMSYNSGRPGVTDTMVSSFWYANLLAVLSKTQPISHSVYCRQALLGGYYELIQHNATTTASGQTILRPNPDYWIARLYKQTVGQASIGPIVSFDEEYYRPNTPLLTWGCCDAPGKDKLLVHAFCAAPTRPSSTTTDQLHTKPGDATLVLINLDAKSNFTIKFPLGTMRSRFLLTSASNTLRQDIQINSRRMNGISNSLGAPIQEEPHRPLQVPRESITFAVIHGANIESCIDLYGKGHTHTSSSMSALPEHHMPSKTLDDTNTEVLSYYIGSESSSLPSADVVPTQHQHQDATVEMNVTFNVKTSIPSLFAVWFTSLLAFFIMAGRVWGKASKK